MSRKEIITSTTGFKDTPLGRYQFPSEEGSFVGTLVYRAWHPSGKPCLICFFDTNDGEYFKLMAWWNNDYAPKDRSISFANDVVNGGRWKCEYKRAPKGSMTWLTAEKMEVIEN